ncbi:Tyrosine recombinase XerC [Anaerolineae bacterium]|nr:Tyrosine recombinase XerC [Anaerolineae bacterium]
MLANHIDRYLLSFVSLRSPQTIDWYRKRLNPLKALNQNISSVTLFDLQQLYAQLANKKDRWVNHPSGRAPKSGGLALSTLRGYVRAWRAFFNWCVDDGVLMASPARKLKPPPLPKQPPKAIEHSDMERIVEAARLSSARDYAICCILADSACRVGGLCNISLDNLDLDRSQAIVMEKGQTRFLLFTQRTVTAIRAYLLERPDVSDRALFIGHKNVPLKPGGIHALLDRLARQAGIHGRHNPHAFRHGWARHALQQHADISDVAHVLGHSQVQTTYEFYGRWDTRELHAIHARYTPLAPEDEDILPTTDQAN